MCGAELCGGSPEQSSGRRPEPRPLVPVPRESGAAAQSPEGPSGCLRGSIRTYSLRGHSGAVVAVDMCVFGGWEPRDF